MTTNQKIKTMKRLKKDKREVKRLEKLATEALITGNKESYIYVVRKMREAIGKTVTEDVLEMLYNTSRDEVLKLFKEGE